MNSRLQRFSHAATLITLVVMAWQINLPVELLQLDAANVPLPYLAPTARLAEITALIAIATCTLAGWPNLAVLRSGWRRVFALALISLIAFASLSIVWSPQHGLAAMQALHLIVWAAFALLIACADCPPVRMAYAFLFGLLLHSFVGFIQIAWQPWVQITPQNSGISVVFNHEQHLQRIYGLSPHPNILGGYLAVGVILTVGLIISRQYRERLWLIVAWAILWIAGLLTFSRSAWLAAIGGSIAAVLLLRRGRHLTRSLLKPIVLFSSIGLVAVLIFAGAFQPFLANRFDVTATPYETQAITERVSAAQSALQVFAAHPLGGVGLAQSVVVTRDRSGATRDWVHNVPLLVAAELGVGGSVLMGLLVTAALAIGVQRWRARSISMWQAPVGGALIALVLVMQLDHYVWTMPQGGLLCAWLVGWWLRADHNTAS